MKLAKHGRRVDLSYTFAGRRVHRSWPDKETMHHDLESLFWFRDQGIDVADLIKIRSKTGKLPNLENVGPKGPILFRAFVKEKYMNHRMGMLSPNSKLREKQRLLQLISEFGDKKLHEMDAEFIEDFRNGYAGTKRGRSRLSATAASALNHIVKPLKAAFKMAAAWGYLRVNPLVGVKLLKEPPGRDRYITLDGLNALVARSSTSLMPWVILGVYTGLRRSAIAALTRNDIDSSAKELIVRNSKGRSYRVYLHDEVMSLLDEIMPSVNDARILREYDGSPARFPYREFKEACLHAGLDDFHFHDLRHTYATWLRSAGVDPMTVAQLLGHRVAAMTGRYAHLTPEQRRKAIETLPALGTENRGTDNRPTSDRKAAPLKSASFSSQDGYRKTVKLKEA